MKSFDTELKEYAQKARLKAAERHELRERILTYMEYHPLPKSVSNLQEATARRSFSQYVRSFNAIYVRIAASAFAVLLILVSIPFAAENAVPGDVLYPIKTKINEGVRAQFINSPYDKVVFETELMERRIAEARLLEKEGKLSDSVEAQIAETVKSHADAAQEGIAELKATDAEEGAIAEIAFSSALDVRSAVFANDAEDTDVDNSGIAGVVKAAKASVDASRGTSTPSYGRLVARVEESTTRAHELLESIRTSATDVEQTDIERRLHDIEEKVASAKQSHENDQDDSGAKTLASALGDTQKLISFMTDIDVRENVAINTLVPIVLTPEERITSLETILATLQATSTVSEEGGEDIVVATTTSTSTVSNLDTVEIATELSAHIAAAKEALTVGDIETALKEIVLGETLVAPVPSETSEEGTFDSASSTEATAETTGDSSEIGAEDSTNS